MTETPQDRIDRLAEYWDAHSAPAEGYQQVEAPPSEPMVVFSLRLPQSAAQQLRAAAEARGLKTTELAREWIMSRLNHPAEYNVSAATVASQLEQLAAMLRAS